MKPKEQPGASSLWLLLTILCAAAAGASSPQAETVALLPGDFALDGPGARQTLVLERVSLGRFVGQVAEASFSSSDPGIVRIEEGAALPVTDGSAVVRAGGASAKVTVTGMSRPFDPTFRNHVQPVLARAGCSSGACHGAASGKNGFKLSLRGYDDAGDHRAITRHAVGRRIVPSDPARSLFLLKPTGAVPHKGGRRFAPGSREYRVLAEWIASGAPPPREEDPRLARIEIVPSHAVLRPGAEQQLIVRAHYSDGSVADATPWAKYAGTDSSVAVPDEAGRVRVVGSGEGAVTAWYQSKLAAAIITVPTAGAVPEDAFLRAPRRNFIDDLVLEKLRELRLPPSPRSTDAEFLRRAFIDAIGVLPSPGEARAFLADRSPDRRDRLIEALLARPEFVDYWTYRWSDLLLVTTRKLPRPAMLAYSAWIRDQVASNAPWDEVVRRIVTATGGALENGAACFFLENDDPTRMAEAVSQTFLGMSIQCAKCHNHPMEKWTNDQYYGFASLFARVRTKSSPRAGNNVVFNAAEGELVQPLTGRPQLPRPLDAAAVPAEGARDRREFLADWLVHRDNPHFARSIVNRVWAYLLGTGLVEAVDDLRLTNPASNEKLLSALAGHLADRGFDLKALIRLILQSETYQRSSRPLRENAADRRFYSRYAPKRLIAEVLLDALSQVTGVPTEFTAIINDRQKGDRFPPGWRAIQLPDSKVDSYFLKSFGRPERTLACECERTSEPSMAQALHVANGETVNQKLRAKGNRIEQLLAAGTPAETIVEEGYLAALSRFPTPDETRAILEVVASAGKAGLREAVEDLYWAIFSSKEFQFNH